MKGNESSCGILSIQQEGHVACFGKGGYALHESAQGTLSGLPIIIDVLSFLPKYCYICTPWSDFDLQTIPSAGCGSHLDLARMATRSVATVAVGLRACRRIFHGTCVVS